MMKIKKSSDEKGPLGSKMKYFSVNLPATYEMRFLRFSTFPSA